jgi:cytochrome c-type biogenesis protein CcmH/NrfF
MALWEHLMLITWVFALVWGVPIVLLSLITVAAWKKGKKQLMQKIVLEDDGA